MILNIILQDTNYKMMPLNDKENSNKVEFYDCLIVKSQQLNPLYNSSLIDFSLTLNYTTFMITIEDFKIIFPYVGVLPFTSVF